MDYEKFYEIATNLCSFKKYISENGLKKVKKINVMHIILNDIFDGSAGDLLVSNQDSKIKDYGPLAEMVYRFIYGDLEMAIIETNEYNCSTIEDAIGYGDCVIAKNNINLTSIVSNWFEIYRKEPDPILASCNFVILKKSPTLNNEYYNKITFISDKILSEEFKDISLKLRDHLLSASSPIDTKEITDSFRGEKETTR